MVIITWVVDVVCVLVGLVLVSHCHGSSQPVPLMVVGEERRLIEGESQLKNGGRLIFNVSLDLDSR